MQFATLAIAYDPASGGSLVLLAARNGLSVHAARVLEMRLRARDGLSEVSVMSSVVPASLTNRGQVTGPR